jgi:hypothetical protein
LALFIILASGALALQTHAADSRWGWDGGCAQCPEHLNKHLLTEASWIRISFNGDAIYSNKTATANWTWADAQIDGWSKLGVKIIVRSAFHPPGLTDTEILPWIVEFNRQIIERYGDRIVGLQPLNEPWFDDEYVGDSTGWPYQYKRVGASHNIRASIWKSGYSGTTMNELIPESIAWLQKLRDVLVAVHRLAAAKGIKVYGPHWQSENYVDITRVAAQLGVLDGVDVFSFGCIVTGDGFSNYIDDIIPLLGSKPWACVEFHLNHAARITNLPDYERAGQIKRGMEHWREMGVQCVLIHAGLQNWSPQLNDLSARLCGYANNQPEETLRVIQVALSAQHNALPPAFVEKLDTIQRLVTQPRLVPVTEAEIGACSGVSAKSARAIITKHRGKVIAP